MSLLSMKESHPALSGLAGLSLEELFRELPTPCYILDEARLRQNGGNFGGCGNADGLQNPVGAKSVFQL